MKQDQIARIFVMVQVFLVIVIGKVLVVPLATLVLVIASASARPKISISVIERWMLLTVAFISCLMARAVFPPDVKSFDWLSPPWLMIGVVEFLMFAQVVELLREHRGGRLPYYFPAWGIGVMIGLHHRYAVSTENYLFLLAAFVSVSLAVAFFQANRSETRGRGLREYGLDGKELRGRELRGRGQQFAGRTWLLSLLLLLACMLAWQSFEVVSRGPDWLSFWSVLRREQLATEPESFTHQSTGGLTLITREQLLRPKRLALRVFSEKRPGYLRGQVFDVFDGQEWRTSQVASEQAPLTARNTPSSAPMKIRTLATDVYGQPAYALNEAHDAKPPWTTMRISNSQQAGSAVFLPLDASYIDGSPTGWLKLSPDGIVAEGFSTTSSYNVYVGDRSKKQSDTSTPVRSLSRVDRNRFSGRLVSSDDRESVRLLAEEATLNCQTVADKIAAVEAYCQANFRRSKQTPNIPSDENPIAYFLLNQPPAHCEYFASAAVALLRELGIPCRYVTGYVVTKRDVDQVATDDYWVAHNTDAHAWVEAYDDALGEWNVVEATPALKRSGRRDRSADGKREPSENDRPNVIAPLAKQPWYLDFQAFAARTFANPFVLIVATLLATWVLLRRWYQETSSPEKLWLDRIEQQLRKHDLVRAKNETLHQFAQRIRVYPYANSIPLPLHQVARWLTDYAHYRYGETAFELPPPPQERS